MSKCEHDYMEDGHCAECGESTEDILRVENRRLADFNLGYREENRRLKKELSDYKLALADALAENQRQREAHKQIIADYKQRGTTWPSMAAAAMCDISLNALKKDERHNDLV